MSRQIEEAAGAPVCFFIYFGDLQEALGYIDYKEGMRARKANLAANRAMQHEDVRTL